MNPYLISVSHSSPLLQDDSLYPQFMAALTTPEWERALKQADVPSGMVIEQVLKATGQNMQSDMWRHRRQSLVAALAKMGLGLPSPAALGEELLRDTFLAAMLVQAQEQGHQAWEDMEILKGLCRACADDKGKFTDVHEWLFKQGLNWERPLVGATVGDLVAVMGMEGYHVWWSTEENIRRRVDQLLHLHAIWVMEDDGLVDCPDLAALWLLAAEHAQERMPFQNKRIASLFEKLEQLRKNIGMDQVIALLDHPSAFVRSYTGAKAARLVENFAPVAGPESAWKAAWKAARNLRPWSMVSMNGSKMLAAVEAACGSCPLAIECDQPIDLVQWSYAARLAQMTDHPDFSRWLRDYYPIAEREGAAPAREVLGQVLAQTSIWTETWSSKAWNMLKLEVDLEAVEAARSKVRL